MRSGNPCTILGHLDSAEFERALVRAIDFEKGRLDNISFAEAPFLRYLWCVIVKLRPETIAKVLMITR